MRDLSMHILDIGMNSISAQATEVEIEIEENTVNNVFNILIKDNGVGMTKEQVNQTIDPFFTTRSTRRFGFGVPMFKATVERCNGIFTMDSVCGEGTVVKAYMEHNHIDRPPLGNMVDTIVTLILANENCDIIFNYIYGDDNYKFNTKQVKNVIGDISITNTKIISWIRDNILHNVTKLCEISQNSL